MQIRLLGAFEVVRDGQAIPPYAWRSQKARKLLKLLLTHAGHPVPRDRLIEWLWPETDPLAAVNILQVNVSRLRRLLGQEGTRSGPLLTVADTYLFDSDGVWIDVATFRKRIDEATRYEQTGHPGLAVEAYQQAATLYRGDYLEEDAYEDWAIAERERLLAAYLEAQLRLGDLCFRLGRYAEAGQAAEAVLEHDRSREAAYRQLIVCHYLTGNQAAALMTYARCVKAMRDELDIEPSEETAALYGQVRDHSLRVVTTESYSPPASPRLRGGPGPTVHVVGREAELAALETTLALARESIRLVALSGEAGMGKTTLVERFARRLAPDAMWARAYEINRVLPLHPLKTLLRREVLTLDEVNLRRVLGPWAVLARHLPDLRARLPDLPYSHPLAPNEEQSLLLDAVSSLLATRLDTALIMILEDAHWADELTLQAVHRVMADRPDARGLVILTYRPEELATDHPLNRLCDAAGTTGVLVQVVLSPLTPDGVEALLAAAGLDAPSAFVERLHDRSGGNPLYLTQFIEDLAERRLLGVKGGTTVPGAPLGEPLSLLPISTQRLIRTRVDRLPPAARRALQFASAMDEPLDVAVWAAALGVRVTALGRHLEDLLRRRFLLEQNGGLEFVHDIVRQCLYEGHTSTVRQATHQAIARALRKVHAGALDRIRVALARQHERASEPDLALPEWAAALDRAAGTQARLDVLAIGTRMESLAGQVADTDACDVLCRVAEAYNRVGEFWAEKRVVSVLHELGRRLRIPDLALRIALIGTRASSLTGARDDFVTYLDEAWGLLERGHGTPEQRAEAMMVRGLAAMEHGRTDEAESFLEQSLTLFQQIGDRDPLLMVYDTLAWAKARRGLWIEALVFNEAELALAERLGRTDFMARAAWNRAGHALQLGDVLTARDLADQALTWAATAPSWLPVAQFAWVDVRLHLGETSEARDLLDESRESTLAHPRPSVRARWHHSRARVAMAEGHIDVALDHLAASRRLSKDHPDPYAPSWAAELGLAEALLESGDAEGAQRLVEHVLRDQTFPAVRGMALRLQGLLLARAGHPHQAEEAFAESVELLIRSGRSLGAARTVASHGRALAPTHPRKARRLLRQALAEFRRLSAVGEARAVERMLSRPRSPSPA